MKHINKQKHLICILLVIVLAAISLFFGYKYCRIRANLHPNVLVFAMDSNVKDPPKGLVKALKTGTNNFPDDTGSKYTVFYSISKVVSSNYAIVYEGSGVVFHENAALKSGDKWILVPADDNEVDPKTGDYVRFNCSTVNKYHISKTYEKHCIDNFSPNSTIRANTNP